MVPNDPYQNTAPGANPCLENAYRNLSMPAQMDGEVRAERTCPPGSVTYVVNEGDTLYSIARLYGTTVSAILAANPGIGDIIYIGQTLCIPAGGGCNGTIYVIQAGDTFYSIARRYGIAVNDLIAANPTLNPNNLQVGMRICIPAGQRSCPAGTMAYVVVAGDTFWSIARRYGVTVEALMAANPSVPANNLRIGMTLCIPMATAAANANAGASADVALTCPAGMTAHTVVAGDTFWSLAQRYGTTVAAIQAANPGVNPNTLRIGSTLCIPTGSTTTCPAGTVAHVVVAGDTFWSLAQRYGTTVAAIQAANPGVNPNTLRIGSTLCIPQGTPTTCPAGTMAHVVVAGDTFWSLAQKHGTTVAAIQAANPGVNPNNLQIGSTLCIPHGMPMPTTCPAGTMPHTVVAGDTFWSLAQKHGTTVAAIQAANPGVNPNNLQIGSTLCIPMAMPTTCPAGTMPHTVVAGDTFWSLAQKHGTTVAAIQAANPGVNPNNLQIGSTLCIPMVTPPPRQCPSGTFAYTVVAGDTLYSIARRYGTTVDDLMAANPGIDPNNLRIGSTLCVPMAVTPQPCPTGSMSYTVMMGDTLTSIADRFSVSVFALTLANPGFNAANITPGTRLCIAPQSCTPPCPEGERYKIGAGEDMASVAKKFGTTTDELLRLNPFVPPCYFVPGNVICVPRRAGEETGKGGNKGGNQSGGNTGGNTGGDTSDKRPPNKGKRFR